MQGFFMQSGVLMTIKFSQIMLYNNFTIPQLPNYLSFIRANTCFDNDSIDVKRLIFKKVLLQLPHSFDFRINKEFSGDKK